MQWFKKICFYLLIVVFAAVTLGIVRSKTCFIPGIQGLFLGMLLGAIIGKLASNSEEMYSFSRRLHLSLVFSVLFVVTQTLTVSILNAEPGDTPFTWMRNIIFGYADEYFFSMGRTRLAVTSASGQIEGFWWIMMSILETGLFAFGSLVGMMIGLPSGKKTRIAYKD